ncbi:hypothetical protein P3T76_000348 [Phytophthora citrophthora]|uniref:Transmembrane protein n=1 Tax=Phytophthora citrophthora TaxID=4793 RepID=A0AAD9H1G8_9STRA|nr:hypothetical protein P3T76_000348 [Phytophthora citrophthora]
MARRATERQSVGASSTSDGGVDDNRLSRDSWLSRSTICANEEDDDAGDDADTCSWSQLRTPPPFSVLVQRRDVDETNTWKELKDSAVEKTDLPYKGKRKLPLLSGFSNIEALQAQLPRSTSKQTRAEHGGSGIQAKCDVNSGFKRAGDPPGHVFSPSKSEIEANRTKWDLERNLHDTESACGGVPERKRDRGGNLKPVASTTTEEEGKERKWGLERELLDGDSASISYRTRELRRKLQRLNPFATKMCPAVASAAEVEAHRRKWDLERNLEETHRLHILVNGAIESEEADLARKLPTLSQFTMAPNPVIPSAAEVEAHRRKWDLERRLQDDSTGSVDDISNSSLRRKLGSLSPVPMTPIGPSTDDIGENRRKWDLERRLQDGDQLDVSVSSGLPPCKLPSLNLVASSVPRRKWDTQGKVCSSNGPLELKVEVAGREGLNQKLQLQELSGPNVADRELQHAFEINESLVYLILFCSTAVLHCAIFNFNLELRQFLRLDIYPLGILLLLSWAFVGLIHFVGGVVGDLVADRVALVRRTAFLWGIAVVAIHLVSFKLSPVVSSLGLGLGLSCAGVAHGIICPNLIALNVESKLCAFGAVTTHLSPQDDSGSSSSDEEDSGAESELSYSSDVSTATTDEQHEQHEHDVTSHNFFAGCFAARLAGSSIIQGYYFLMVNVDMFASKEALATADSRGFNCMLLMSVALMASLVFFCFEFWDYYHSDEDSVSWGYDDDQQFELKLATLDPGVDISTGTVWIWTWSDLVRLCNRALVSYALVSFALMTLIGVGFSLVVVLLATQTSLSVRLVAFLLIVFGWLLTMVAISRQMNPTKKQLLRECRRLGLRSRHFYLVMFAVAFICVSGCVAFLRAQLYTTMVVQVCQTHLVIPGTTETLFDPELLGTVVGTSSLILLGFSRLVNRNPQVSDLSNPELSAKTSVFALSIPSTPTPQKTWAQSFSLGSSMASYPPVTRMCLAMLLYLIGVFMSSVVELYRRKAGLGPSILPRSCGSVHSEFTFLWASPYVVLLGVSDALFRVSLQEACHGLARGSFASPTASHLSRRWAGTVQGAISLAEALGYTTALSLVSVLSRWLFQPEPTDMALLFLLLTTMVALTHAVLNRIATRAQTYQRLHFRCNSTT